MNVRNQFVFLLGPHRSGTSLTAGGLHSLQVNLGNRFIEPNEDNPKGFFEDEEIVNFNDRLLRSINLSWDSLGFLWDQDFTAAKFGPYHAAAIKLIRQRFASSRISGLKDPRFCLLLPFWKKVISDALDVEISYVLTIREPAESVISQQSRHIRDGDFHIMGRRQVDVLLLWLTYIWRALRDIDPNHLLIVDYATLLDRPGAEILRLAEFLGLEVTDDQANDFCVKFVEPSLNRSNLLRPVRVSQNPRPWGIAEKIYSQLIQFSKQEQISREDISNLVKEFYLESLRDLYLQEVQYMYGFAYKKSLNLRHRLLKTMNEMHCDKNSLSNLVAAHDEVNHQYSLLTEQYKLLDDNYNLLQARQQEIFNSKGWKFITLIRRLKRQLIK